MGLVKSNGDKPQHIVAVEEAKPKSSEALVPSAHGKPLSEYEIERERRIHVSGLIQAYLQSPALVPFVLKKEDLIKRVEEDLPKLIAIVQKHVKGV